MDYGRPWCRDGISIKDLSLQFPPHSGLDAWGREKEQPVLVSLNVSFENSYESAADKDALDGSTIHYGVLAKSIRGLEANSQGWGSLSQLALMVEAQIFNIASSREIISACQTTIKLPKASLLGDYVVFVHSTQREVDKPTRVLHISNIFIPTLIGVNDNERKAKQKLLVSVWVYDLAPEHADTYAVLEGELVKAIEPTTFETLESLALHVVRLVYNSYSPLRMPNASIRLRFDKPQAVPFAEAPAIEIFRTSRELSDLTGIPTS